MLLVLVYAINVGRASDNESSSSDSSEGYESED
jgi:hypothetical protein